ncbi:MAG: OmpA family protein [Granulosicoccus sp.]
MKKLLLLAIVGLALGGGIWKSQNPEGTIADFQNQSLATAKRLTAGVEAGINAVKDQPTAIASETLAREELENRLANLETQLSRTSESSLEDKVAQIVSTELADTRATVQSLVENNSNLESLVSELESEVITASSAAVDAPAPEVARAVSSSLQALKSRVDENRAGTDAGNDRLDAIDRQLEVLVSRLDEQNNDQSLNDNFLALTTQVEDLTGQLEKLTSDTLTEQVRLDTDLNALEEKTSDLDLRIELLAQAANPGALGTDENPNRVSAASDSASLTAGVDDRLVALEAKLAELDTDAGSRIDSLASQLDAAQAKIVELETREATASRSLSEVNTSIQNLQVPGDAISIETVQEEIIAQLSDAQATLEYDANQENTSELTELLETTRLRVQNLEQRVQDLPASTEADAALTMQSELQSQIAALERRLEDVSSTDPELQNTVMNVKEQVEQLKARGESNAVEYKIYFDRNSASITDDAAQVLNSFITQEQNRTTGVSIFGFTDRIGSAAYNQQLALERATNVRSYLIQNGLDYTKIKALSGLGEDAAVQVLPDNAADANQRVVILYADQP